MWIVCITSVRHVLTVNGYGGRQTKENEKSWCFKGWETLVNINTRLQNYNPIIVYRFANVAIEICFSTKLEAHELRPYTSSKLSSLSSAKNEKQSLVVV